jgi:hypothetical protein
MKSRDLFSDLFFRRAAKSWVAGLALVGGARAAVAANTIVAGAVLTDVQISRSSYSYTLTLQNDTNSTSNIGLFWFAWEAGQADFLASEPTDVQTPAGWEAVVEGGGADDGYSIQFVTYTDPLPPGSSATFTFESTDSPTIMGGPAEFYPEYKTLTSQVYSSHEASGLQAVFIAKLVQTNLGLLTARPSGSSLTLNWTAARNIALEQSPSPTGTNWTVVPGTLARSQFIATNLPAGPTTFYRLGTQ